MKLTLVTTGTTTAFLRSPELWPPLVLAQSVTALWEPQILYKLVLLVRITENLEDDF